MKKLSFLCVAALLFASCASEDNANQSNKSQQDTTNVPTVTFVGYQPETTASAKTRTTATHERGKAAKVFWEPTDRIWVKNDQGTFRQSDPATFPTASNKAQANFKLRTSYWDGYYKKFNPEVRYVGTSNNVNSVRIANQQTQTNPNDFSHLGAAGDCGTATAQGGGGDHQFTLEHKASYLCFVPRCMNTMLGPNIYLTKIKVTANKPIAGSYDFTDGSLENKTPTGYSSNEITLTLTPGNFTLNTTTENTAVNGAYMVITPGTYDLTINYTIKDPTTNIESDIVKIVKNFNCPVGKIRDMKAWIDKDIKDFSSIKHYMWDAQLPYWYGHENEQPIVDNGTSTQNPKNASDPRWFNPYIPLYNSSYDGQTALFRRLPNTNEMLWYVYRGDPHAEKCLAIANGHLQQVWGIWLKKKARILHDQGISPQQMESGYPYKNPITSVITMLDYTRRTNRLSSPSLNPPPNQTISISPLTDKTDYFFIPALGGYVTDQWYSSAEYLNSPYQPRGDYWTRSASSCDLPNLYPAISFSFYIDMWGTIPNYISISVRGDRRENGNCAMEFQ